MTIESTSALATGRFRLLAGFLHPEEQADIAAQALASLERAPLFTPVMPRTGKPFSVRMSNFGTLGWVSDRTGYRYESHHPQTGLPWPLLPPSFLKIWHAVASYPHPPEACLVNYYGAQARMGLHVDGDEDAVDAPVVSISLGDTAVFRIGGRRRSDPTKSVRLSSGDVVVLGGHSRHVYHGIDRIIPGTSRLLPQGGRMNLTLRRVTVAGRAVANGVADQPSYDSTGSKETAFTE